MYSIKLNLLTHKYISNTHVAIRANSLVNALIVKHSIPLHLPTTKVIYFSPTHPYTYVAPLDKDTYTYTSTQPYVVARVYDTPSPSPSPSPSVHYSLSGGEVVING